MKQETKDGIRGTIAVALWLVVFGVGLYVGFLRYICANPVPYDPVTNHPYTCMPPYTTLGSVLVLVGIVGGATLLSVLYWKFGFPRKRLQKDSGENRMESKV